MRSYTININDDLYSISARRPVTALQKAIARYLQQHPRQRTFKITIESVREL